VADGGSLRRRAELDRAGRRRAIVRTAVVVTVAWVALVGGYYLLPFTHASDRAFFVRLVLAFVLFAAVLVWQVRQVIAARLPAMRAVQALGVIVPLYLVLFSAVYLSLSHGSASHFNEPLDHTDALYLTVTVFSSVGFGDIAPRGDLARILVTMQMLVGLIVLGAVVRVLINAATRGERGPTAGRAVDDEPSDRTEP
jgi:hypothetical protein